MCHRHGHAGTTVCGELAAPVEAEPADPEHRRTRSGHAGVVGGREVVGEPLALAEEAGEHQRGRPGAGVHDEAAGEVHDATVAEPAAAPDPVADRRVHHQQPESAEDEYRLELDPLHVGADDQRRCDDRERHLEHGEGDLGDSAPEGVGPNVPEERLGQRTDHPAGGIAEGHAVADDHPQDAGHGCNAETVHDHGQNGLRTHQAAVEHRQARQCHEQDQGGRDEDPRGVAGVHGHPPCCPERCAERRSKYRARCAPPRVAGGLHYHTTGRHASYANGIEPLDLRCVESFATPVGGTEVASRPLLPGATATMTAPRLPCPPDCAGGGRRPYFAL